MVKGNTSRKPGSIRKWVRSNDNVLQVHGTPLQNRQSQNKANTRIPVSVCRKTKMTVLKSE